MKSGFLSRLLDRAEKLDKERIVDYMTEIAQERDLLILIFDSMTEGMIVIDENDMVIYINPSARTILDLGDGTTTPEQPLSRVLFNTELLTLCKKGIKSSKPLLAQDYTFKLNNKKRFIRVSMIPLQRTTRRFGTLFLFNDETDTIVREQKLREAEKLAALTTLSAGMSHEIRNPLNSLSIHLQLLQRHLRKKGIEDGETKEVFNLFSTEIKRLNDVIDMFLSAVRPSQPEMRTCNLYNLLTQTLHLMEPEFRQHQIKLTLHEEGKWPLIEADARQMEQVFINLLKNAIEAITSQKEKERKSKPKEITLRMIRHPNTVTLVFEDTGKGIDDEDLPHIFEPYFTKKPKGTGLGLMIVDRIVREHHGSLKAHSQPGKGTQIVLSLPITGDPMGLIGQPQTEEAVQR